jgi:hypothetical protein
LACGGTPPNQAGSLPHGNPATNPVNEFFRELF